jgi:hypothetical protein
MLVEAFETIQELIQSMKAQQAQLDQRLARLPQAVVAPDQAGDGGAEETA